MERRSVGDCAVDTSAGARIGGRHAGAVCDGRVASECLAGAVGVDRDQPVAVGVADLEVYGVASGA